MENTHLIEFPEIGDPRGNLCFVEGMVHIPFEIRRIYYLFDVPEGAQRGGHAHHNLEQVLIPLSGSFTVDLFDGKEKMKVHLTNPRVGLYISNLIWREMLDFSTNSVCLVLASKLYDETDYVRSFNDYLEMTNGH